MPFMLLEAEGHSHGGRDICLVSTGRPRALHLSCYVVVLCGDCNNGCRRYEASSTMAVDATGSTGPLVSWAKLFRPDFVLEGWWLPAQPWSAAFHQMASSAPLLLTHTGGV
jgi:hypothetical protein